MKTRASIRLRLTIVYAVVIVGTCAALLALNYALLYSSLYGPTEETATTLEKASGVPFLPADANKQASLDQLRSETLFHTAGTSAIALAAVALLGLGLSWFIAGRMLRPLRTLTAATRRISQDRLHERIGLSGPRDELRDLADTFDEMLARLSASFEGQRRFVADASHELRTPLAIIRSGTEVLLAKRSTTVSQWEALAGRTLTATSRAERLVDALLSLARSDSGVIASQPHDLAESAALAISEADAFLEVTDPRRGDLPSGASSTQLAISHDLRSAPVLGDPVLLDRLVRNLVDNGVRHNVAGGTVSVTTGVVDQGAVVTIVNTGPVVPADEVERLFEPFQRLGSARVAGDRSVGLGLAIVRSIVRAHGGSVVAVPNADGGLTVTVALPVGDA